MGTSSPMKRTIATLLLALLAVGPATAQNAPPAYVEPANLAALVQAAAKEGMLTLGGQRHVRPHRRRPAHPAAHRAEVSHQVRHPLFARRIRRPLPPAAGARSPRRPDGELGRRCSRRNDKSLPPYCSASAGTNTFRSCPTARSIYDGRAVKLMTELVGFSYNTKLIPPNEVPRSFADLLKPQWKGKIATSPYQGTFMSYLGLPNAFGPQRHDRLRQGVQRAGRRDHELRRRRPDRRRRVRDLRARLRRSRGALAPAQR